jgi:valyl-tRNA synthetase
MSPFVPFITDMMYQNLNKVIPKTSPLYETSIHFLQLPQHNQSMVNEDIEKMMNSM